MENKSLIEFETMVLTQGDKLRKFRTVKLQRGTDEIVGLLQIQGYERIEYSIQVLLGLGSFLLNQLIIKMKSIIPIKHGIRQHH